MSDEPKRPRRKSMTIIDDLSPYSAEPQGEEVDAGWMVERRMRRDHPPPRIPGPVADELHACMMQGLAISVLEAHHEKEPAEVEEILHRLVERAMSRVASTKEPPKRVEGLFPRDPGKIPTSRYVGFLRNY